MDFVKLSRVAKLAYPSTCNRETTTREMIRLFPVDPRDILFVEVQRTDTEGFLFRSGSMIIIAFAGTESWRDMVSDAWFLPGSYYIGDEKMVIHSGFADVINQIRLPLVKAFRELFVEDPLAMRSVSQVVGVGHSLGAVIALGALDVLWYVFPEIQGKTRAVTFGCPNGWSGAAAAGFECRHPDITHYINPWDYVTWFLGLSSGRPGRCVKLSGRAGHFMDKYIENMEERYVDKPDGCSDDPAVSIE